MSNLSAHAQQKLDETDLKMVILHLQMKFKELHEEFAELKEILAQHGIKLEPKNQLGVNVPSVGLKS